jgi:muramoyltetrapeptide carboxypeptidase LdcA involved in peptidoglycan recycling
MIKPDSLKVGDKIAIVSLSSGLLGDDNFIHKYYIAKDRLENDFGLVVETMPNALKGSKFIYEHPEARAKDLMDAFKDNSIKAIICAIGGDDTIRILPYIDFDVIKENPKIFMGYSDTTVNHFMMNKAGLVSFYGPCIVTDFAEYVSMAEYTKNAVTNILFSDCTDYEIDSSKVWSKDFIPWDEKNINKSKLLKNEEHGYEVIQGSGVIEGEVLGGCIDVFPMIVGTDIWPNKEEWHDKILLIETCEEKPSPDILIRYLRNLGVQGIFDEISGIIVGKPYEEEYYEEYKNMFKTAMKEFNKIDLPIIYNINIGHAYPTGIIPLGTTIKVDLDSKKIFLEESPTKSKTLKK